MPHLADGPRTLAVPAGIVGPIGTGERCTALPAERSRGVCDHAIETVAVLPRASILPEEATAVAPLAVLAVLAGAVLADLAVGNGGVGFGRALAAVADRRLDHEPAAAAREWLGAAALELADPGRGEPRRARRNTGTVQKIPAITADLTSTAAHIHKPTAYRQGKFGEVEPPCCVAKCQLRLLGASRGGGCLHVAQDHLQSTAASECPGKNIMGPRRKEAGVL